ncbi:PREDICTED: protein Flattop homolog isoform X1 [Priapulus caudatus]|uniref:Cilia- and flagella-associated protein 126 n=1 Tax=Priapulus caudatus TaxID=37621 RepID=A0ABM1EGT0_PRICU|nr:PREDICTED: protein Flattop homolog isoform X1 [Priapulus caudatus]
MAYHFSANQYEKEFNSKRLQNWELPKNQKERPRTLQGFTRVIVNDRGHLLSHISQSPRSPWGEFVATETSVFQAPNSRKLREPLYSARCEEKSTKKVNTHIYIYLYTQNLNCNQSTEN